MPSLKKVSELLHLNVRSLFQPVDNKWVSYLQVVTETSQQEQLRHFLDSQQYTTNSILRYEKIFGPGFVSTGGLETTQASSPG